MSAGKPAVLFVCVHNAGRSQMAAALLEAMGEGRVEVHSAGTAPAESVNPVVVDAMNELGIDLRGRSPNRLDRTAVQAADVIVTMGCGDACPVFPGKLYLDWALDDPAGAPLETVRPIRNDIKQRVSDLLDQLPTILADASSSRTTHTNKPEMF